MTNPARTRRHFPHANRGKARIPLWELMAPYNCRIYHGTCHGARHRAGLLLRPTNPPIGACAESNNRGRRRMRVPAKFAIGGET